MSRSEMDTEARQRIEASLLDLREGMLVDGYALQVRQAGSSVLEIEIQALENACADCLVPKPMMQSMIEAAVPDDLKIDRIDLVYPTSAATDL